MRRGRFASTVAALIGFMAGSAAGQTAAPPKALTVTAENLTAAASGRQRDTSRDGAPAAMRPGDVVRYRLTFSNANADSLRGVQFTDPLPGGLQYVAGSATADREGVEVTFSIDGGRTYSTRPVIEELVDGKVVRRPAPASMYTHVRWTVDGWLQRGARVVAEFQAQLPGSTTPGGTH